MNKYKNIVCYNLRLYNLIKLNTAKDTNNFLDFFIKKHKITKEDENSLKSHSLNINFDISSLHKKIHKNRLNIICKTCKLDLSITQLWFESPDEYFINSLEIQRSINMVLNCNEQIIKNILE